MNNILPLPLLEDEEAEETVSGSLGREINEIICPKLPTPPQSKHSSPCASPPPPPSTPPPEIVKEEFTLEYLLAQHSHVQSLIEKNRRRLDVLPQKRIWYRNSCLNENIHLYLTELRDRLENFLLDQYRQERDGYIDFPCQQHYLTKDLFKLFSLCDEFEQMKQQILQPPTNSTELLTRSAYLEEARTKPLIQLVASVAALKTHFITLTQVVSYTEEDVSKSAYVFFGPDQIIPMLDISVEVRF